MQEAHWYMDILRTILGSIDNIVYGLINTFYQLFAFISKLSVINFDTFKDVSNRIYMILGIVMLFKVAFSLISYLANPDDLTDSKKGVTGIVQRILISLAMLMFVPTMFNLAYRVQAIVIEDNILGNFILGTNKSSSTFSDVGGKIGFTILRAFYYEDPKVTSYCESVGDTDYKNSDLCGNLGEEYRNAIKNADIDAYLSFKNKEAKKSGEPNKSGGYYRHRYNYLITTIAGIIVAWLFFGFCFDVAIRSIKLTALQLIAPIPILSYIEPKKGEGIFKKWISTCFSTFISLFMKLILIYFALFICNEITVSGIQYLELNAAGEITMTPVPNEGIYTNMAKAFIYIGLFLFVKDAPKLIGDIFGIKLDSSFGMKVAKAGMVGTGLGIGLAGAKAAGEAYKTWNRHSEKGTIAQKLKRTDLSEEERAALEQRQSDLNKEKRQYRRAITTGITSGAIGAMTGAKLNWKGFQGGMNRANTVHKRRNSKVSLPKEIGERTSRFFGVEGEYGDFGQWKTELRDAQNLQQNLAQSEEYARRNLTNSVSELANQYAISDDEYASLLDTKKDVNINDLITKYTQGYSGQSNTLQSQITEMQERYTKMQLEYDSIDDKTLPEQQERLTEIQNVKQSIAAREEELKQVNQTIDKVKDDFGKIDRNRKYTRKMDDLHQKQIKETNKLKKQYESVQGKK